MHHQLVKKEAQMAGGSVEAMAALQCVVSMLFDRVADKASHILQSAAAVATLKPSCPWMVDVDML